MASEFPRTPTQALSELSHAVNTCKAACYRAYRESIEANDLGLYWWRLFGTFTGLKGRIGAADPTAVDSKSLSSYCGQLASLFDDAAEVWGGVDDQASYKRSKVKLVDLELRAYSIMGRVSAILGARPFFTTATSGSSEVLFWSRFFGLLREGVSMERFALALRLHMLVSHNDTEQLIAPPDLFCKVFRSAIELDKPVEAGQQPCIEPGSYSRLLQRYGPFLQLHRKVRGVCTVEGRTAHWFMKVGGRTEAGELIRQGVLPWLLRRGRLAQEMAFVLTYHNSDRNGFDHIPVNNSAEGYYFRGEPARKFATAKDLVADICVRMGWYQSGFALKEASDKWIQVFKREEKTLDLTEPAKFKMLSEFFGPQSDPTSPFSGSQDLKAVRKRSLRQQALRESVPSLLLSWLDEGPPLQESLSGALAASLRPADPPAARAALATTLGQIWGHIEKQTRQISSLAAENKKLRREVGLYAAHPEDIGQCTTEDLMGIDKKLCEATQRVKAAISKSVERSMAIPPEFVCPLTREIFTDPVITKDGHTYERAAIEMWLANHDTSPLTNTRLADKSLTPNISLRNSIDSYRQNRKFHSKNAVEAE